MINPYCPKGHNLIEVGSSLLYTPCYYCEFCDKIYEFTIKEVTREYFKKNFNSDRWNEIKKVALIIQARDKVTEGDLKKLGYIKAS